MRRVKRGVGDANSREDDTADLARGIGETINLPTSPRCRSPSRGPRALILSKIKQPCPREDKDTACGRGDPLRDQLRVRESPSHPKPWAVYSRAASTSVELLDKTPRASLPLTSMVATPSPEGPRKVTNRTPTSLRALEHG